MRSRALVTFVSSTGYLMICGLIALLNGHKAPAFFCCFEGLIVVLGIIGVMDLVGDPRLKAAKPILLGSSGVLCAAATLASILLM